MRLLTPNLVADSTGNWSRPARPSWAGVGGFEREARDSSAVAGSKPRLPRIAVPWVAGSLLVAHRSAPPGKVRGRDVVARRGRGNCRPNRNRVRAWRESNPQPLDPKSNALSIELQARNGSPPHSTAPTTGSDAASPGVSHDRGAAGRVERTVERSGRRAEHPCPLRGKLGIPGETRFPWPEWRLHP
jgi:hypothetical protein